MTPDQLATLARAMGYEVEIDATGGYGVERVIAMKQSTPAKRITVDGEDAMSYFMSRTVFRPHDDAAQALEVLCWLLAQERCNTVEDECVRFYPSEDDCDSIRVDHNNTPPDIRRAIVEAAVRVAEGMV